MLIVLWLFFVLLNGKLTMEIVLLGMVISGLVFAFACAFMEWNPHREWTFLARLPKVIVYGVNLVIEIVKANFVTMRRVLSRKTMTPAIATIHTSLEEEWQRVLLANAITLTPGTITLHLEENTLVVHCLSSEDAELLEGMPMEGRIAGLGERK